jgi:outer membrane protein OmpA-like peptidoglycan-associated protein
MLRRSPESPRWLFPLVVGLGLAVPSTALAEMSLALHAEGAGAHLVGNRRADQFGFGGVGQLGLELALGRVVGVELPVGIVGVSAASDAAPGAAKATPATGVHATPGLRVRPLGALGGRWARSLWIAGGAGVSVTGAAAFPAVSVRAGVDVPLGPVSIGPYGGLLQVVDHGENAEDARIVTAGLHGTIDLGRPSRPSPPPEARDVASPAPRREAPEAAPEPAAAPPAEDAYEEAAAPEPPPPPHVDAPPAPAPAPVAPGPQAPLAERPSFPHGEWTVRPEMLPAFDAVARYLVAHPEIRRIRVAGHADDTGSEEYNERLSEWRARAAARELAARGVDRSRMVVEFYGSRRPLFTGTSPEERQKNRRVEVSIVEEVRR